MQYSWAELGVYSRGNNKLCKAVFLQDLCLTLLFIRNTILESVLLYPPLEPQFLTLTSLQYPFLSLRPRGQCFVSSSCNLQRTGLKPLHAEDSPWQQDAGCVRLFSLSRIQSAESVFLQVFSPFFLQWQKAVIWKHLISDSWRPPIRFPPTQMTKGVLKPWQETKRKKINCTLYFICFLPEHKFEMPITR